MGPAHQADSRMTNTCWRYIQHPLVDIQHATNNGWFPPVGGNRCGLWVSGGRKAWDAYGPVRPKKKAAG
jgi:hypothetical protein